MMTLKRLHELFEENPQSDALAFDGQCHDCGREVRVDVWLSVEGFVIRGGALYEPEPHVFINKCDACHEKNPRLSNFRKCEVYSRVVGYLRPVAQWNEGKQAEFTDRSNFRI